MIDRMQQGDTDLDDLVRTLGPRSADPDKLREVLQESLEQRIPLLKVAGVF